MAMLKNIAASRSETLRKILLDEKKNILNRLRFTDCGGTSSETRMGFEKMQDNADRSVEELLKHVDVRITSTRAEVLDLIEVALARLDEGTYGICDECGCEIPEERLHVLPFVSRCVHCQEAADRLKKIRNEADRETGSTPPEETPLTEG